MNQYFAGLLETVDRSTTANAATMVIVEDQEIETQSTSIHFQPERDKLSSIDVAIGKFTGPLELLDDLKSNIVMRKTEEVIKEVLDSIKQVSLEQDHGKQQF